MNWIYRSQKKKYLSWKSPSPTYYCEHMMSGDLNQQHRDLGHLSCHHWQSLIDIKKKKKSELLIDSVCDTIMQEPILFLVSCSIYITLDVGNGGSDYNNQRL